MGLFVCILLVFVFIVLRLCRRTEQEIGLCMEKTFPTSQRAEKGILAQKEVPTHFECERPPFFDSVCEGRDGERRD